jgi:hypothetical protein
MPSATSHQETPPATLCACGHPLDEHDTVAARYCQATASGDLPRGCVCVPEPQPYTR